ncbi:MAG: gliding motility protein GldM [Eudoraea sp.]|nr:gliding motility protein GldM [Eudoraea sp.]
MGHGKETPRQKMIGMMYLVLTALLAMNVSKDVLDAFVIVDKGLVQTTENFAAKNEGIYHTFDFAYAQNPEKVGDWKERADEVKRRSDELYEFINECKVEIVSVKDADAIINGEVDLDEVKVKDDNNVPAEVMLVKGKGLELKEKIDDYRHYMEELISHDSAFAPLLEAIHGNLDTHEHPSEKAGEPAHSWESHNFEHLPLAGVITRLSAIQANVRNVESDVLGYLLQQVDAKDFKVNVLEAIVLPESNNVFKGQEYRAQVFLAAYDSTKIPEVVLENGDILPVEAGKGIFTATSQSEGTKPWGGVLRLDNDGEIITREFQASYTVAATNAVISATKMNVLYRGVDNPVSVSASGVPETAVRPRITAGTMNRVSPGNYIVRPGPSETQSTVNVYADVDGSQSFMGNMLFRVENLPDPTATVARSVGGRDEIPTGFRKGNGSMTLRDLTGLNKMVAIADGFLFDVQYEITEFKVNVIGSGGVNLIEKSESNTFTQAQQTIFRRMRPGQRVTIEDIKAIGPDGVVRDVNVVSIKII